MRGRGLPAVNRRVCINIQGAGRPRRPPSPHPIHILSLYTLQSQKKIKTRKKPF